MRFRSIYVLILPVTLGILFACSAKTPPTQAAMQGEGVISTLKALSSAYENKDLDSFMGAISDNFKDREALSASISAVFRKHEAVHFNIQYKKMLILIEDRGAVKAAFNWDAEWRKAGGAAQKDGGRITFVFEPKNNRLLSIEGKNPFVPVEGQVKQ